VAEREEPELVVRGRAPTPAEARRDVAFVWTGAAIATCFGVTFASMALEKTLARVELTDRAVILAARCASVLVPTSVAILGSFWSVRRRRRWGSVAFFADRVVVERGGPATTLAWSEITSFRDDAHDVVELLTKTKKQPTFVPTLDESSRTAVLDLLARRGLARVET
jgi:hypothetical protein